MPILEAFALVGPEIVAADIATEEAARLAAIQIAEQEAAALAAKEAAAKAAEQASINAAENGITQVAKSAAPELTELTNAQTDELIRRTIDPRMISSLADTGGTIPGSGAPSVTNPAYNMFSNNPLTDITTNPGGPNQIVTNGFSPITGPTTAPPVTPTLSEVVRPMYQMEVGSPAVGNAFTRGMDTTTEFMGTNPFTSASIAYLGASKMGLLDPKKQNFRDDKYNGPLSRYQMSSNFQGRHADPTQYQYTPRYAGGGGIMGATPVEQMSNNAMMGTNTMYPMANISTSSYGTPDQMAEGGQVPGYASGGFFKNVLGDVAQFAGDAGAGVGQFVNNLGQGRVSIGRPESDQTAEQIARKYYTNTAPAQNVNPQQYQYSPQYAEGGVAKFAKGKLASLDYYTDMLGGERERQIAAASNPAEGKHMLSQDLMRDTDPDTAYLSAPEAAAVRMGKVNSKAYMQGLTLPRPKPINRLNLKPQGVKQAEAGSSLDPEMAASGGIMGASSLGSYAAGGNSRLLKGPGDGMSDNIPATIAGKQPARLADGEFVIPADVVSHLGNGSTEAGAKKLHEMMNKIRKARTGNPKQGKQINPNKFMPT